MPHQPNVEIRIMPNGNGDWYWEVLDGRTVMARGSLNFCKNDGLLVRHLQADEQACKLKAWLNL
jgi:hypothetical protein